MIDDRPDLQRRYRSPRAFGPMPGPRNIPASVRSAAGLPAEVTTSIAVTLEADPAALSLLLPPGLRLSGRALLTVTVSRFENLLWLAGRGYPILTVTTPVEHVGDTVDDTVRGRYLAVLWEGLADPVTTGREELGYPKLPAEIRAPGVDDVSATGDLEAAACWDGFRFLDLAVQGLRADPAGDPPTPKGTIVHRYVPSVVEPGRADVDQLVYHPVPTNAQPPTVTDRLRGSGRFTFYHAGFADSPVQYPVVNTLAALSLSATGPATLTRSTRAAGSAPDAAPRILGRGDAVPPRRATAGAAA